MTRFAEILARAILWTALLIVPILAHAGGLGLAPVGFVMGLAGLLLALSHGWVKPSKTYLWVLPFLAMLIWLNITVSWSPYQPGGLTNAYKLAVIGPALIFVPYLMKALTPAKMEVFRHVFMAGGLFIVSLMTLDVMSGWGLSLLVDPLKAGESLSESQSDSLQNVGHGLYTYAQYAALLIVLYLTTLPKPWGIIAALVFCGVLCIGAYLNLLMIVPLILAVVLPVMALAYWKPRFFVGLALIGFVALILFAPVLGLISERLVALGDIGLPSSWDHRLRMWAYAWQEIQTQPLLGQGFDASRTYQDKFTVREGHQVTTISLHTHNIGTQIWLEIGAIGAALAALTSLLLWRPAMAYASTKWRGAALAGLIAGTAIVGATSLGVWQFWWWGSIAFSIAMLHLIPAKNTL